MAPQDSWTLFHPPALVELALLRPSRHLAGRVDRHPRSLVWNTTNPDALSME